MKCPEQAKAETEGRSVVPGAMRKEDWGMTTSEYSLFLG